MFITAPWAAITLSIGTSIFWIGYWFGKRSGQGTRLRRRIADLERAFEKQIKRPYVTRYTDDGE
jgi:hypothetical protein